VQAGSPNFLRLTPLFWVLRNDILEALLHAARDALDHLRRRSAPKGMGPPARVAVPTRSVDVMAPAGRLPAWHTHPQEFRSNDTLNVPLSWQEH
jgi:hypothetical protein